MSNKAEEAILAKEKTKIEVLDRYFKGESMLSIARALGVPYCRVLSTVHGYAEKTPAAERSDIRERARELGDMPAKEMAEKLGVCLTTATRIKKEIYGSTRKRATMDLKESLLQKVISGEITTVGEMRAQVGEALARKIMKLANGQIQA